MTLVAAWHHGEIPDLVKVYPNPLTLPLTP